MTSPLLLGQQPAVGTAEYDWGLPTGGLGQNGPRHSAGNNLSILTSGQLFLVALPLRAGTTVSSITFVAGATGAATSTHVWFSLWSAARAKLGVTSDDTAASPWNAAANKTLSLATPYVVTDSGLYYAGVVVVATTVPTLRGFSSTTGINGIALILSGTSDGSLVAPGSAPATAAAITASASVPYVYVS